MIGRGNARAAIGGLINSARESTAAALILVGEAGMGKTALCDYADEQARSTGCAVIHATGVQWEAGFELAAMTQLLRPLHRYVAELAPGQRDLLAAVIDGRPSRPPDSHAFAAATMALLLAASEEQPLVGVVDDVHWIDRSSIAVLGFVIRRLFADGIAMLFAQRDGEPDLLPTGWPRHILAPMTTADVRQFLASLRPDLPTLPAHLADTIRQLAAGNPLALHELAPHLTLEHLTLERPLPDPLPLGPRGQLNFSTRIAALPAPTRQALAVVAAAGSQKELVTAAFAALNIPVNSVDAAFDASILVDIAPGRFVHPLCRAAAYAEVPSATRRRIHLTLAELNRDLDPGRFAWHLDLAGAEPGTVADAYHAAAQTITARAGDAAAATAWIRAAEFSPAGPVHYQRALHAATSLFTAGDQASCERWLDEILTAAEANPEFDPDVLAGALLMKCQSAVWYVARPEQLQHLTDLIKPLESLDPGRLVIALGLLSAGFENRGELKTAVELTDRAVRIASQLTDLDELIAVCWKAHTDTLTVGAKRAAPIEQLVPLEKVVHLTATNPMHVWTVAQTAC